MKLRSPAAAPRQPSASASALASLSTKVGRPVASASRLSRGKARHAGMFSGETASPAAAIGPPDPTPQTTTSPLPSTEATTACSTVNTRSGSSVTGVGALAWATRSPSAVTKPAASLVPPTSMASATSMDATLSAPRPRYPVHGAPARLARTNEDLPITVSRPRTATRSVESFAEGFEAVAQNVAAVIQGKNEAIRLALVCLMAEGHLLIEDVPGVGKTSLAKALAASLGCSWGRIQFTPDLLPSDVTGVTVYNRATGTFEFRPGGIFANLVIGDEINRASPKTQSALLEAMEERQVTVDRQTYPLAAPFMVIATQNPVEHEGTYPLPESQLDRFLMRITMGYPGRASEIAILDTHASANPLDDIKPVASASDIQQMVAMAQAIHVAPSLKGYIVDLA